MLGSGSSHVEISCLFTSSCVLNGWGPLYICISCLLLHFSKEVRIFLHHFWWPWIESFHIQCPLLQDLSSGTNFRRRTETDFMKKTMKLQGLIGIREISSLPKWPWLQFRYTLFFLLSPIYNLSPPTFLLSPPGLAGGIGFWTPLVTIYLTN